MDDWPAAETLAMLGVVDGAELSVCIVVVRSGEFAAPSYTIPYIV